jgi:RNA ligase (TIGR02306 family)
MERKLASIQRVNDIRTITIEGIEADSICEIRVQGWRLIANKADFQIGDLCVYFEIDSLFKPELAWVQEHVSFMDKYKWRVRTLKMNKFRVGDPPQVVISQGLAIPVTMFGDTLPLLEGADVTELLGVDKYDPIPFTADTIGRFPAWLPKTDEARIQSALELLDELQGKAWIATMKLDGTSCSVWWDDGLHIASRNLEINAQMPSTYLRAITPYLPVFEAHSHLAFQGEVYGEGVQSNRMGAKGLHFAVFNVFHREQQRYLEYPEMQPFCEQVGLPTVPLVISGEVFNATLAELEDFADNLNYPNDKPAEGIVVRPRIETTSITYGERLSFKVISKRFLLRYE